MQNRIDKGQIKGVTNAEDIIRKGHFTYEQAKNLAKAGTIESLTYDAVNGIVYSGTFVKTKIAKFLNVSGNSPCGIE